jgi:hypothetical protein
VELDDSIRPQKVTIYRGGTPRGGRRLESNPRRRQLPWAARRLDYGLGLPHTGGGPADYRTQYSNTPRSHNSATADIETGPKLIKHRGGKILREDVDELRCSRDMEDADLTDGNLLSDEMKINLHMLCALVLNGVGGEVHGAHVVTVDESAGR